MKHTSIITILLTGLFCSSASNAKIVDCPSITLDAIEYSSHDNYVEAYDTVNDKNLWRTELFTEYFIDDYNVFVESDAQWNIACIQSVDISKIVATDNRHRTFYVDTQTGKLDYKTKNGQVVTGNDISYANNLFQKIKSVLGVFYYVIIIVFFTLLFLFLKRSEFFKKGSKNSKPSYTKRTSRTGFSEDLKIIRQTRYQRLSHIRESYL